MRNTARQTRENRAITVDFHHEATYGVRSGYVYFFPKRIYQ